MPQAERYCRLVRYVERLAGGNPWKRLEELEPQFPMGLMQVLSMIAEKEPEDEGEPIPAELGPLIEPLTAAKLAYEKADVIRRRMYEKLVLDKNMLVDEMVQAVAEDLGNFPAQLDRYLLIKRYVQSLDERQQVELLEVGRKSTLDLAEEINRSIKEGSWRDPGEPSFHNYPPAVVIDDLMAAGAAAAGTDDSEIMSGGALPAPPGAA